MFVRKRKKKEKKENEEQGESIADALNSQAKSIDAELMRLEERRKRGEISDDEYFEVRKRLESLKKQMQGL